MFILLLSQSRKLWNFIKVMTHFIFKYIVEIYVQQQVKCKMYITLNDLLNDCCKERTVTEVTKIFLYMITSLKCKSEEILNYKHEYVLIILLINAF